MVALNWQTFDLDMQINCAMLDGGQDFSGYVLKPALLQGIQVLPYEPELPGGKNERTSLPANKAINPYVEVEVFHASAKREKRNKSALPRDLDPPREFRTNIVRENGFNPSKNYNDRPAVATYTAKLSNLKQGHRTLPLLNNAGDQYLFSKLFCKIKVDSIKMMIDAPAAPWIVARSRAWAERPLAESAPAPEARWKSPAQRRSALIVIHDIFLRLDLDTMFLPWM
ncbi:hypothetical protein FOYG_05807 [Fusarium oxysporum NRRL 32931]|uniref:phosphoinositide phospholipase C n=1 Tax=Fusarium oxysporum NRRL 32931 TaxID=660029 RepID=W9IFY4_FUSOX|nr:hypothetical protein FOYG_05807 [Fusarium oxysporum NRRL 32931]